MNGAQAEELLRMAEEAGAQLAGREAKAGSQRLEARYQEFNAALSWFLDQMRADEGLRLALALVDFWQSTSRITDGRERLGRVLSIRATDDVLRAEALFQAGLLAFWQGDDEAARRLHHQSLDLARRLGDPTGAALALTGLARIELRADIDRARALSQEALDTVAESDEQRGHSNAVHLLGVAAQMQGELEEARHWMSQRLELAQQMGSYRAAAGEAANLSTVERQLGNLSRARDLAREALTLADQRGDDWLIPYCLNAVAAIDVAEGTYERAVMLLAAAERLMTQQGTVWPPDEAPHFERSRATAAQVLAPERFQWAWSQGQALSDAEAVALCVGQ